MANAQSVSSRAGVEPRSHDGATLRSGRCTLYESPVVRRQVTPSLERNLVDHRLGTGTATVPSSPSSSLLLTWLLFVALIIRCRQIFKRIHENLSQMKIYPFTVLDKLYLTVTNILEILVTCMYQTYM